MNDGKILLPLIESALKRGHEVECWLDQRDISQTTKWYEFPEVERFPPFRAGMRPTFRIYVGIEQLEKMLFATDARLLFSIHPPKCDKPPQQTWAHVVPSLLDSIGGLPAAEFDRFDIAFFNSQYWIDEGIEFYDLAEKLRSRTNLELSFRKKWKVTGTTQFDHIFYCDRDAIRIKLGLPPGKKIVTVFAFETNFTYWSQRIFLESRLWKRLWSVLIAPFSFPGIFSKIGKAKIWQMLGRSIRERPEWLWQSLTSASELETMRAIRIFCDRNDALLVLKARRKHNLSPHHHELSDIVLEEDREYLPSTSFQVLSVSDLMITLYSTAAVEAATCGVPTLNLVPPKNVLYTRDQCDLMFLHKAPDFNKANLRFYQHNSGGVFNFPGVVESWTVNEAVKRLPTAKLGDFKLDPEARKAYMLKYVAPAAGPSAERILDQVERLASPDSVAL